MKKIFVIGTLGRDPEPRADKEGNQFTVFSIAVNSGSRDNKKTDWINVICNSKLSDIARNYLKKGMKVYVEGIPSVRAYINKQNEATAALQINAYSIEFFDKKEQPSDHEGHYVLPEISTTAKSLDDLDDIPF